MSGDGDPFLGETVGKKPKDSSVADAGVEAGLGLAAEIAPLPFLVVSGVIAGAGLLGFLAWKAVERAGGKKKKIG